MSTKTPPTRAGRPMRDALLRELDQEGKAGDLVDKKLGLIIRKMVARAVEGDLPAIKEIFDRIDGRPSQAADATAPEEKDLRELNTAELRARIERAIARAEALERGDARPRPGEDATADLCERD